MKTQHFLVKIQSDALSPCLDRLIIELETRFEELLRREILFVKQCYYAGRTLWWRKFFHVGIKMPSDEVIKNWILSQTHPPFWMCLNPKVMALAHRHFKSQTHYIKIDLRYARKLVLECKYQDEVSVWMRFVNRHQSLKSVTMLRQNSSLNEEK